MNLSENYKTRLKSLSGIKLEEIQLKAVSGRSEKGTLSFFVEEYILGIGESFINTIETESKKIPNTAFELEQGSVNISKNSLLIDFSIVDYSNDKDIEKTKFSLSISVNLESSSNTIAMLRYGTLNDEFNLQSKHSSKDVSDLIDEIVTRALNVKRSQN